MLNADERAQIGASLTNLVENRMIFNINQDATTLGREFNYIIQGRRITWKELGQKNNLMQLIKKGVTY